MAEGPLQVRISATTTPRPKKKRRRRRWCERFEGDVWRQGFAWQHRKGMLWLNVRVWRLGFQVRLSVARPRDLLRREIELDLVRVSASGGWRFRRVGCVLRDAHEWSSFTEPTFETKTYRRSCLHCDRVEEWNWGVTTPTG